MELNTRCREGFRKLLAKCGFAQSKRMPRLVPCGGRKSTLDDFKARHARSSPGDYIAMLIDSEDPLTDLNVTWRHLRKRDKWAKPNGATDDQVLFMTTCMETWIVSDRDALKKHYRQDLNENSLPPLSNLEGRARGFVQGALSKATKNCSNCYEKGKRSFEVLGKLDPAILRQYLPSFDRAWRILDAKL